MRSVNRSTVHFRYRTCSEAQRDEHTTYFRLPLSNNADPEMTEVVVPATQVWEAHDQLPTCRLLPIDANLDLASGRPLAGRRFDRYFADLQPSKNGLVETILADPGSGRRLVQTFTNDFTQ